MINRTEVIARLKVGGKLEYSDRINPRVYLRDSQSFEHIRLQTFASLLRLGCIVALVRTSKTPWYRTDYIWRKEEARK